jgi:hypothetical protein
VPSKVTRAFWPGVVVPTVTGEPPATAPTLASAGTSYSRTVTAPVAEP